MAGIDFNEWLGNELNNRGWSQADLARKSGLSSATISRIMSGQRGIGFEASAAIAEALEVPIEIVMVQAGLLRSSEDPAYIAEQIAAYKLGELTTTQLDEVIQFIEFIQTRDERQLDRRTSFKPTREGATPPETIKE